MVIARVVPGVVMVELVALLEVMLLEAEGLLCLVVVVPRPHRGEVAILVLSRGQRYMLHVWLVRELIMTMLMFSQQQTMSILI